MLPGQCGRGPSCKAVPKTGLLAGPAILDFIGTQGVVIANLLIEIFFAQTGSVSLGQCDSVVLHVIAAAALDFRGRRASMFIHADTPFYRPQLEWDTDELKRCGTAIGAAPEKNYGDFRYGNIVTVETY